MTTQARLSIPLDGRRPIPLDATQLIRRACSAGSSARSTIALWFLLLDVISGRPLFTPTVLGTALFRGGAGLGSPETLPVSIEMVAMFTWVHLLVFAALGGIVARLLGHVQHHPQSGFGVLLRLFVRLPVRVHRRGRRRGRSRAALLSVWSILVANLLAAAAMIAYFRRRHPGLRVSP